MTDRELDALLAEHLFGWKWIPNDITETPYLVAPGVLWVRSADIDPLRYVPHYSTTWEGLGLVVTAMEKEHGLHGHNGFMLSIDHNGWYCEFPQPSWEYANADTAPQAAAMAALKALGAEAHP